MRRCFLTLLSIAAAEASLTNRERHQGKRHRAYRFEMAILSASFMRARVPHPVVRWAVGGWTLFVCENAVLSENRTWLIDSMGDDKYHVFYGTCSTIATVSIGK